jgi:hypothetical protein
MVRDLGTEPCSLPSNPPAHQFAAEILTCAGEVLMFLGCSATTAILATASATPIPSSGQDLDVEDEEDTDPLKCAVCRQP